MRLCERQGEREKESERAILRKPKDRHKGIKNYNRIVVREGNSQTDEEKDSLCERLELNRFI